MTNYLSSALRFKQGITNMCYHLTLDDSKLYRNKTHSERACVM